MANTQAGNPHRASRLPRCVPLEGSTHPILGTAGFSFSLVACWALALLGAITRFLYVQNHTRLVNVAVESRILHTLFGRSC